MRLWWFFDGAWMAIHALILIAALGVVWRTGPWSDGQSNGIAILAATLAAAQGHGLYACIRKYLA